MIRRHISQRRKSPGPFAKSTAYWYEQNKEDYLAVEAYAQETGRSFSETQIELIRAGLVALGRLPEEPPPDDDRLARLEGEFASFRELFERFMAETKT